ncbi:MAG: hypothetical protein J7L11_07200 [Thermoprotei archaeon]|nr:hypothetical protein [Thermoprotei archaeon]
MSFTLGFATFMLYKQAILAVLVSGGMIPLTLWLLREGYREIQWNKEFLSYIGDLEELIMALSNRLKVSGSPERALMAIEEELKPKNKFLRRARIMRELIMRGVPASKALRLLENGEEPPIVKAFLQEIGRLLEERGTGITRSLLIMVDILRRNRKLLEDYESKLRAQRVKIRMLSGINAASLGLLAYMTKIPRIMDMPSLSHFSQDFIKRPILFSNAVHNNALVLIFMLFSLLTGYYSACIVRDPEPHKGLFIAMAIFGMTYMLLNALLG